MREPGNSATAHAHQVFRVLRLLWIYWVAVGCRAERDPLEIEGASSAAVEPPRLECEQAEYPCTWAEVPAGVELRSRRIARDAADRIGAGTPWIDVASDLARDPAVVEVLVGEDALRFRVTDGPPEWIYASAGPRALGGISGTQPFGNALATPRAPTPDPVHKPDPVGTKPRKKALILSPFAWQWTWTNSDDRVDEIDRFATGSVRIDFDLVPCSRARRRAGSANC